MLFLKNLDMRILYINLSFSCLSGGRYIIGGSRSNILVVREARPDDPTTYACEAQHALTGEKRKSKPAVLAVSRKFIESSVSVIDVISTVIILF